MSEATFAMPDRFAWLFGQAEPSRPAGSLKSEAEFTAAWHALRDNWQVLPVTAPRLSRWAAPALRKCPAACEMKDRLASVTNFARVQLQVGERFARALEAAGIPYALLKGSAARFTAYPDPLARCGKDIDLVTTRRHLGRAEKVARDVGFVPSQWNPGKKCFHLADPGLRARVEAQHYELGFLVRRQVVEGLSAEDEAAIRRDMPSHYLWHEADDGRLACYVSTDIHHALSLDIPADGLLAAARRTDAGDVALRVPSPAWLVFHLIFKIYWEGVNTYRKGLYQFVDLLFALRGFEEADCADLVALLEEYHLQVAAYYVLRRLETDLGEPIPDPLAGFVEQLCFTPEGEEVSAKDFNDMGDMWPKLWGYR